MAEATISERVFDTVGSRNDVPTSERATSSGLAANLVRTLNRHQVAYCHWKSNFQLYTAYSNTDGREFEFEWDDTDLDLLVDRRCWTQVSGILLDLGFKPAAERGETAIPGVSHFYGLDPRSGQFVHVHLFSRVVTGESFLKSHVLPFQAMLLDNLSAIGEIPVPSRSAELIVFVLRIFIKYGSLLDVIYLRKDAGSLVAELNWLSSKNASAESLLLLRKHCPVIDERLFIECLDSLRENASLLKRLLLAWRVRRRLRIYETRRRLQRSLAYARLLFGHAWQRFKGKRRNKTLRSGGAVIAITGAEATGKSTMVSECGRWLAKVFAAKTVHVGKPPASWLTLPFHLLLPAARLVLPRFRTTRQEGHLVAANSKPKASAKRGLAAYVYAVAALVDAWDRRNLLLRSHRAAASGEFVICDRYPSDELGAMDSRRLHISTGTVSANRIYNFLVRVERRLYSDVPPPDVVLRLGVSVETAKQRNQDRVKAGKESSAYVESRHRRNRGWRGTATRCVYDIDTEHDLAATVLDVKTTVWKSL